MLLKEIFLLRVHGNNYNFSILSVHAPNVETNEDKKGDFYDLLEDTLDSISCYNMKIIAADLNTKVGQEDIYIPTIGK